MAKTIYTYNGKCYWSLEDAEDVCFGIDHPEILDDDMPDFSCDNIFENDYIDEDDCPHNDVTIHSEMYRASSLYEPAEYIYTATCNFCGKTMDGDDVPEGAKERDD